MIATSLTPTSSKITLWQPASWADYERQRDKSETSDRHRLYFHNGYLWVNDMGWEGIGHARVHDLFTAILTIWFLLHPDQKAETFGGALLEKPGYQAAAPDLVLYLGDGAPTWKEGQSRHIDLNTWRIPDLVGEVSDTTLAVDLDEMKQLYAALGIPEYWVINVKVQQVLAFGLQENGKYQPIETSLNLTGLPIALLEQTLDRLTEESNISAAQWFMKTLVSPPETESPNQ
ncbi:MAG: Uma2 family endonuclease [Cyanobacteria bacterium]|nr:Uma2 family endonuclease [Cyanobacteriota bacterium]